MRWNVVIGGQMLGKAFRGLVTFHLEWGGREGVGMALGILSAMCITLLILIKFLPPWQDESPSQHDSGGDRFQSWTPLNHPVMVWFKNSDIENSVKNENS